MDKFIEQQRLVYPMSDEAIRLLVDEMDEVSFPKGDLLVREGDRDPFVWFVRKGLIRSYVERETKDITLWFASDGEMTTLSIVISQPIILKWWKTRTCSASPARRLEELFEHSHDIAIWGLKLLDYYLREYENYFINDSWSDAREQYEALLRSNPELFQRVPLKHIASYLQITPQSLSRIRSSSK